MIITHDLAIGGLQQVIVNLCKTIDRNRFHVSVLCLRSLGEFAPDVEKLGIKVILLPQTGRTDYFSFLKVAKILRKEKIEVIHTHNTQPFIDGTLGALLSGVKKIVHTDHARNFPDKMRYMIAERIAAIFADHIVAVSDHTANNLINYEKIPKQKICVIPNGIDGDHFRQSIDVAAQKAIFNIPPESPVIGLGVRLSEQKGITYLLAAMPAILSHHPDTILLIAGSGPLETQLLQMAIKLGIDSSVRFVGPLTDIRKLLCVLDLYVLPSLWEGLPMVIIEAMAAGIPVIATDVGGTAMAINNEYNGILVPPTHQEALSENIVALLGNHELRALFVKRSAALFRNNFEAYIMAERYMVLYNGQFSYTKEQEFL